MSGRDHVSPAQFGDVTPEQIEFARQVSDEVHDRVHKEDPELRHATECMANCGEVSEVLSKEFGWEVEGGYTEYGDADHYWNRSPGGTIVDATVGQFFGDQHVAALPHWSPEQAEYTMVERGIDLGNPPWGPGHPSFRGGRS